MEEVGKSARAKGQERVLWDNFFWVRQAGCTHGLTVAVAASTRSKLSTLLWEGKGLKTPPSKNEELLAVDDCGGREHQFSAVLTHSRLLQWIALHPCEYGKLYLSSLCMQGNRGKKT